MLEWRRVLRDGGVALIAVPDLDTIAQLIVSQRGWFTPPHEPWVGVVYGGQKDEFDFHKTGFTLPWLAYLPIIDLALSGVIAVVATVTVVGTLSAQSSRMAFAMSIASGPPVG